MKAIVRSPARGEAATLHIEGITASRCHDGAAESSGTQPSPEALLAASLASCTATTIESYARRKGWEVGQVEVDVEYVPSQRGSPTRCEVVVRLPEHLLPQQRERLMQVGAISQIHRTLEGEIDFDERVELALAPKADREEEPPSGPTRKRIALLNGLREVLRTPEG